MKEAVEMLLCRGLTMVLIAKETFTKRINTPF